MANENEYDEDLAALGEELRARGMTSEEIREYLREIFASLEADGTFVRRGDRYFLSEEHQQLHDRATHEMPPRKQ